MFHVKHCFIIRLYFIYKFINKAIYILFYNLSNYFPGNNCSKNIFNVSRETLKNTLSTGNNVNLIIYSKEKYRS